MGVDRHEYIIFGQKYEYTNELSDIIYDLGIDQYSKDDEGDFMALVDGMSGQYIIIGQLLAKSDEFEGFDEIKSYSSDELDEIKADIVPEIAKIAINHSVIE